MVGVLTSSVVMVRELPSSAVMVRVLTSSGYGKGGTLTITTLEVSTLTITPLRWFAFEEDKQIDGNTIHS
jgi:hypothetical protein